MSTKAFAYLRVSGRGQVDGDGFPRQLAAIRVFVESKGIKIMRVFREEGVSGAKELEDRPALSNLLAALTEYGVRLVLIEKLDRLARDVVIQELLLRDMRDNGVELVSVTEPELAQEDPNNPTRTVLRQIMGAISQYEKSMIVLKLRGARMRIKAREGSCEGRKPYGYRPGEGETLGRMRQLRAEGLSFDAIARKLNENGIRPRTGDKWVGRVVGRILRRIT